MERKDNKGNKGKADKETLPPDFWKKARIHVLEIGKGKKKKNDSA